MKKGAKVGDIWSTTANMVKTHTTAKAAAKRAGHTRASKMPDVTGRQKASLGSSPPQDKLTLVDLEAELDKQSNQQSLVDEEESKANKAGGKKTSSWADIVRSHDLTDKAFAETVSMQGLGPIFDPQSSLKRKLVWFTIVFFAVIFTSFNIYTQIVMYVGKPISVRVDFQKAKNIRFPTITICNNNFASYMGTAHFQAVETVKQIKPLLFVANSTEPDFSTYDFSYYRTVGWETFYNIMGQNMSRMMLHCQWQQTPCGFSNFTPVFTDMGLCYCFNMNSTLVSREAGRSFGLKLTLDAKQDDYLRSMDNYYGAGFRVVIHAAEVPPIMAEKGLAVSPGLHNFLAINVKTLQNAEPSVSQCGSMELEHYSSYSSEACRLQCRTKIINGTCGCRDLYMKGPNVRICDPPEFYGCIYPTLESYLESGDGCEDQCPEPCSENLYQVTPTSNPLSSSFLDEFAHLKGQDRAYWRDNLVHLEIYLASMTYERVEKQLSYTILELFCDVGGAFGLLLGASLLTMLEIVDYFLCRITAKNGAPRK